MGGSTRQECRHNTAENAVLLSTQNPTVRYPRRQFIT